MPRFLVLTCAAAIAACAPTTEKPAAVPVVKTIPLPDTPEAGLKVASNPVPSRTAAEKPIRPTPILPLAYHRVSLQGLNLSLVCFDDRQYRLIVADQPDGCGSKWPDARSAAANYNGLAAINGGFFTPEGNPLGLLVTGGTRRGTLNPSSLGAGIYASSASGSAIIRREQYASSRLAATAEELLQAGPMLVERGQAVTGLSTGKHRPRSFIAWDGEHHWAIGHAGPCTLAGLARALVEIKIDACETKSALNLDGGRSSDLWVGPQLRGGGQSHRSLLNKAVRNYLVVVTR